MQSPSFLWCFVHGLSNSMSSFFNMWGILILNVTYIIPFINLTSQFKMWKCIIGNLIFIILYTLKIKPWNCLLKSGVDGVSKAWLCLPGRVQGLFSVNLQCDFEFSRRLGIKDPLPLRFGHQKCEGKQNFIGNFKFGFQKTL